MDGVIPAFAADARPAGFIHDGADPRKLLADREEIDVLACGHLRLDP